MDTFKYLIQLHRDLKAQGCYIQAAKCLDAACRCTEALPASRALACFDYAQLLMDHFDNLDLAKNLLLQADRELRTARGHYELKCEVHHHLIECHRLRGDLEQALQACRAGLAAAQGPHAQDLLRWRVYFLFRMAECTFEDGGDADAALSALDSVEGLDGLTPVEKALLALSKAAVNLQVGRMDIVDQQLTACAAALEGITGREESEIEVANRLRSHYFLLYAATAMAVGRASHLQEEGSGEYPVFTQFQEALSDATLDGGGWLPSPAAAALGYMLHAAVLRKAAKGSAAAVPLGQAEELVEQALAHLHIDINGGESDVAPGVLVKGTVYLQLMAALMEQRAQTAMVTTDLQGAARCIVQLMTLLQRFPTVTQKQIPSACMLLGNYAHTMAENDLAISLFRAVLNSPARHMYKLAALSAALSELQRGTDDGLKAAMAFLEQHALVPSSIQGIPLHERASAQLANAIILRRKGDSDGARLLLTKALKHAHRSIGSAQLVGQLLTVMAPVQQEKNDFPGAKRMFESATTLLKSVGDLPSLVSAMHGMHALHEAEGNVTLAGKSKQYLERKTADLESRLKEAIGSADHAKVEEAAKWLLTHALNQNINK